MSPRDRDALDAILAWTTVREAPPSVRELARCLGVGHARAHQLVTRLRAQGFLTWDRAITVRVRPHGAALARLATVGATMYDPRFARRAR